MGDPCECKGLGTRLRDIETQEFLKSVVTFVILDWVLVGAYFVKVIPKLIHGKGNNPEVQVEMWDGVGYVGVGLDGLLCATNGDVTLRVVANPDGRFIGRAIFM